MVDSLVAFSGHQGRQDQGLVKLSSYRIRTLVEAVVPWVVLLRSRVAHQKGEDEVQARLPDYQHPSGG